MAEYDSQKRPLVFPLREPLVIQRTTEDDPITGPSSFTWPEDNDERVLVPFLLSLNEYTVLANAIDVGRDIAYGDDSIRVLWLWLRNMRINVPICAAIIDCITNDADTQEAFADFLANNPLARQAIQSLIDNGSLLIGTGVTVQNDDLAKLFGAVTFLVDTINGAIQDLFQTFEASTNNRERGELIFSAIPVLETLPIDEISEYVSMLEENIVEAYISQWDETPITGTRDRIRCALFCAARDNGNTLTWSMVEDYFWGRVGFSVTNVANVMGEFAVFLATGDWTGEEIIDISFGNFAAAMRNSQRFGEMIFPSLAKLMLLGQNDPDEDWEIVCEDCDEPPPDEGCWDFTASQNGWTWLNEPEGSFGAWSSGGFSRGTSGDLIIEMAITDPVTEVIVRFNEAQGNVIIRALGTFSAMSANSATAQTEHTIPITIGPGTDGIGVWVDNLESTTRLIEVCVVIAP